MNIRKLPFFMITVFELERPYIQMSFTERAKSTPLKPGDNIIFFVKMVCQGCDGWWEC